MKPISRHAEAASVGYFPLPEEMRRPSEPQSGGNYGALPIIAVLTTAMASGLAFKDFRLAPRAAPAAPRSEAPAAPAAAQAAQEEAQAPQELPEGFPLPLLGMSQDELVTLPNSDPSQPGMQQPMPFSLFKKSLGLLTGFNSAWLKPNDLNRMMKEGVVTGSQPRGASLSLLPSRSGFAAARRLNPAAAMVRAMALPSLLFSVLTVDARGQQHAVNFFGEGQRPVAARDPLVFSLDKKPLTTRRQTVLFDISGAGFPIAVNDISAGAGLLVFDADHDGVSGANGREIFGNDSDIAGNGNRGGLTDGYVALNALVVKAFYQGLLPASVIERRFLDENALTALEEAYGLRMKVGSFLNEPVSLKAAGVRGIALTMERPQRINSFDGRSNDAVYRAGAYFLRADGSKGIYEDFWLRAAPAASVARNSARAQARM
ncbi:MAG: hypothetical protein HY922_10905 [Elusimicrobia bacterium]|nr:hypothetical protein [Elusimicrobiota bacterium]